MEAYCKNNEEVTFHKVQREVQRERDTVYKKRRIWRESAGAKPKKSKIKAHSSAPNGIPLKKLEGLPSEKVFTLLTEHDAEQELKQGRKSGKHSKGDLAFYRRNKSK